MPTTDITACPPGFENLAASLHSFTILILKMNGLYSYSYLALSIKTFSTQPLQHKFVDRHVFIMYLHSVLTHTNPCMHMMQGGSLRNLAPPKWWTPFCSSLLCGCSSMVIWFLPGKWFFLSGFTGLLLDSFTQSWLQLRSKFLLRVWPQQRQP